MKHSFTYPDVADANGVTLLTRKRIYILPTRQGLAFAIVLLVMLAGSMNYNNALGFALTFLLVSLSLVSLLHTYRNLAGLRISAHAAEPVFAGHLARFPITVDNPHGPRRDGVVLTEGRLSGDQVVHLDLPADGLARVELAVPTQHRGWRTLARICIASRAPFGIFRAWFRVPVGVRSVVYPHPSGNLALPLRGVESGAEGGHGGSGREDFAGLREYRHGDAVRHIHWKAAARGSMLPVKQFEGARTEDVLLRFDDTPAGDLETRLSQLTAWVLEAQAKELNYALHLPGETAGDDLEPAAGGAHSERCLRRLALYGIDS